MLPVPITIKKPNINNIAEKFFPNINALNEINHS